MKISKSHLGQTATCLGIFLGSIILFYPLMASSQSENLVAKTNLSTEQKAQIIVLEHQLKSSPENITARQQLAELHVIQKNYDRVIQLLEPYVAEVALKSQLSLVEAYNQTKQFKKEVRTVKRMAEITPQDPQAHHALAVSYVNAGMNVEAIESLRKAIQLDPTHVASYNKLLEIFLANNDRYEARAVIHSMLKKFGPDGTLYSHLCHLYTLDGYLEAGVENCLKATRSSSKNAKSYAYLAENLDHRGEKKKAEKILIRSAQRFPSSIDVQLSTADFYFKQNNYPVAERYYRQAVAVDQKSWQAQLGLALSSFENANYEPSLKAFVLACKMAPQESLPKFKQAAATLRSKDNRSSQLDQWTQQFTQNTYSCNAR